MRTEGDRILDMLEAIGRIEKYALRGKEAFLGDELIQTFIVHHLQVLGEAAFKLSPEFRTRHPQIPWPQIMGMRHILVHDYFRVDPEMIWGVVERDLPSLKKQLAQTTGSSILQGRA